MEHDNSWEKASSVFNNFPGIFFTVDSNLCFTYLNINAISLFDAREKDLIGVKIDKVLNIETSVCTISRIKETLTKGVSQTFQTFFLNEVKWFEVRVFPITEGVGVFFRDITKGKKIGIVLEDNHKKSKFLESSSNHYISSEAPRKLLIDLFDNLSEYLDLEIYFNYMFDEETGRLHLSNYKGIPKYVASELECLEIGDEVCGEVAKKREKIVKEDIQNSSDESLNNLKGLGIQCYACYPLIAYGQLVGTLSFGSRKNKNFSLEELDLLKSISYQVAIANERIKTAQILKEKNRELEDTNRQLKTHRNFASKVFDITPDPQVIISLNNGNIVDINSAFLETVGLNHEDIIGKRIEDLNFWIDNKRYFELLQKVIDNGEVRNEEIIFKTSSGDLHTALYTAVKGSLKGEEIILGIYNDITDRKSYEEKMSRMQRLNVLGEIAAGIGHEIRNPLSVIRGNLQLLSMKEEMSSHGERLKLMMSELDRTITIIADFLSLGKKQESNKRKKSINSIITDLESLIRYDAFISDKQVEIQLADIPEILIDENEIRQLILNLARNGLEAMDKDGTLMITTNYYNKEIIVEVKDEGKGIPLDILDKIGTPFFTTKEKGTGLGVMVCKNIALRHNAEIDIDTSDEGTSFKVKFKVDENNLSKNKRK
ncbi:ATP-binding protein [Sporosalibacterium faouarense]|uniref:ATP-binding protein n=1 Tax=Sporosalibacterium faouarense TaxID=516123 RepID=UPI00192B63D3|nr:ATP-binding protein [Sporosalibacterium faouarense]